MSRRHALLSTLCLGLVAVLGYAVAHLDRVAIGAGESGPEPELPVVEVTLQRGKLDELFAPTNGEDGKVSLAATFRDGDRPPSRARVSLRGFSAWHHRRAKPSLRIKPRTADLATPEFVELSRPEDPLALCNWLPDQLSAELGLMHEHSAPVRLVLNGRQRGVYLRSLRPGDDLAAQGGRPRGTFFKGDSLGSRRHLDLWAVADSWRAIGDPNPRARRALDRLLAALRMPPSVESLAILAATLDLEAMARAQAVAVLTASIHADRAHNHVLFFDPAKDRLEPLLWDANGFGIHAEPGLAVDVMRHPLAERLACDPCFVHRRNEILWQLLHGAGRAERLIATAEERMTQLAATLRHDPEIARLVLRRGVFEVDPIGYDEVPAALDTFRTFVRQREARLRDHFADAHARV
ncbi:MAG: CotH kinase family protein, partial [Planctomycetes bacterium]|nr:CotH kinase family protein [Planctomycetota bacterium]